MGSLLTMARLQKGLGPKIQEQGFDAAVGSADGRSVPRNRIAGEF